MKRVRINCDTTKETNRRKTKTKTITYQLEYSANLKCSTTKTKVITWLLSTLSWKPL